MLIIPAIDLLNNACVRLYKGDYSKSKIYSDKPEKTAYGFEEIGAKRIHIVDLDAARGKGKNNRDAIKRIRSSVSCIIEVGGGVRTKNDIEELLEIGVDKLIIGTILIKNPKEVINWIKEYGNIFTGGIDVLNGYVKISGWEQGSGVLDTDLANKLKSWGITEIIYTNISRDGTLSGPDIENTNRISEISGLNVILSGGISSDEDIRQVSLKKYQGVTGLITGKAIYENKIDLKKVISLYQNK
jgi:phosphoribosylformimino-5-aminoimidazole carboxamide ribotide isomerase